MRIAQLAAWGIVVTTASVIGWRLSEREQTKSTPAGDKSDGDGTDDPTEAPTPTDNRSLAPGEVLTISLNRKPAVSYTETETDDAYRRMAIATAEGRATYDGSLSRAAAEVAYQGSLHPAAFEEGAMAFLLRSSGVADSTAARFSLRTNDDGEDVAGRAIDEALSSPPSGDGTLFFGIGEAATPSESHTRRLVVLMVRRAYSLEKAPRFAEVDTVWEGRGELPAGYADARASVLTPRGQLIDAELEVSGRQFVLRTPVGSEPGQLGIGIDGVGISGPGKLFQLEIEVGRELPTQYTIEAREPEPEFESIEDAEAYAAVLLAADRARAGSKALVLDPDLSRIARGHSEEMAREKYFAHQSPSTGLLGDRLEEAGYRASGFAENLAKNDNLIEAERSLLESVGHRANLLSDVFTHVGVGLARQSERGQLQWYVTQVFARKTIVIDVAAVRQNLYLEIESLERPSPRRSLALEQIATRGADLVLEGQTDNIARRIGREARDAVERSVNVSVQRVYNKEQITLPKNLGDASRIGVGMTQSEEDRQGTIAVVIITSR